MLNKIIQFSLQNRLLVLVASVLLLIGGTYTAFHTEVDVFPDLNAPTVVVMTEDNGMAAAYVQRAAGYFPDRDCCKRSDSCTQGTFLLYHGIFRSMGGI